MTQSPLQLFRRARRGVTSPVALVALLATGSVALVAPEVEARHRDAIDAALSRSAHQVVTSQRAQAVRTGKFFAARRWLREGQHDGLVLPLSAEQRVLTYYSTGQGGLVVVVGDVESQRTCSAVVRVREGDRPTRLACGDEPVPQ